EAEWIADGDRPFADDETVRVAELHFGQAFRIDLHDGDVVRLVLAEDLCGEDFAVAHHHGDFAGARDDVRVRDDDAVVANHESGAQSRLRARLWAPAKEPVEWILRRLLQHFGLHGHDGWRDLRDRGGERVLPALGHLHVGRNVHARRLRRGFPRRPRASDRDGEKNESGEGEAFHVGIRYNSRGYITRSRKRACGGAGGDTSLLSAASSNATRSSCERRPEAMSSMVPTRKRTM